MRYPTIVDTIWYVMERFSEDAIRAPNRWETEKDVQAELYRRIMNTFEEMGLSTFYAEFENDEGEYLPTFYSRIGVEHGIRYRWDDGGEYLYHPDLLIYRDLDDPKCPPDPYRWPLLMAFEIKYKANKNGRDGDLEKLDNLVRQGCATFGCWLNIVSASDDCEPGLYWEQDSTHGCNLWEAMIAVPSG